MNKIILIAVCFTVFAIAGTSFSCDSAENSTLSSPTMLSSNLLNDVSSLILKSGLNTYSNSGGGNPDAEIQSTATFPLVPNNMVVYQITKVDDARAMNIAKSFGLENGAVPLKGNNRQIYSYFGDGEVLEVNLDGYIRLYQQHGTLNTTVSLPTENECINIARNNLTSKGLLPNNILQIKTGVSKTIGTAQKGSPAAVEEPLEISVKFMTGINGYELDIPGSRVIIGDQGKVIELNCYKPELNEYGFVNLKKPDAAFNKLTEYLKDPSFNPVHADECVANWRGFQRLIINSVSLEYSSPNEFLLQPVFIFEGDVYLIGQVTPEHFMAAVDAIQRPD